MKKIVSLILVLAFCAAFAACNNNQSVEDANRAELPPAATPAPEAKGLDASTEADKSGGNSADMYNAYSVALENLLQNQILPDGIQTGEVYGDMAENKFAIYDVNNDGKEELIVLYTTTNTAAMAGCVFAYDGAAGELKTELYEFPEFTFYDNGTVKALWSHNQGKAGEFWPYSLYQYNPEAGSYTPVGMVDAWDKNFPGTDEQNDPFPSDIDQSGTGFVYYIMEDGQYDDTHPVDASEYNEWLNAYIANASEIQMPYMDLTEENIARIKAA